MRMQFRRGAGAVVTAILLAAAFAPPLSAQATGTIRGRVTDAVTGRGMSGVQVYIPSTTKGILTNERGDYLLLGVPVGEVTIEAQVIGYGTAQKTATVTADGTTEVTFALSQEAISLDEVVVTGTAGSQTKRTIGNSVSTIQAAELTKVAPISTVDQLLQARTPGLTLMTGAGTVGTSANIRIRGAGSLNAGNRPIFYVDGIRIQSDMGGEYSVLGQSRNPLDAINPEDIESIEVIKGPAASTLYGAEAATGVIQIITKRGRPGAQDLQWTAKVERGQIDWTLPQPINYKTCTASLINNPTTWPGCAGMDPNAPVEQRIITDSPLDRNGQCAAWITDPNCTATQAIRQGLQENYNLSVRGGGERFSFFASGENAYDRGVFFNNDSKRRNGRLNVQVTPLDNLDATVSVGYSRLGVRLPLNDNASNGLLRNAYRGEPGRAAAWEAGYLNLAPREISSVDNTTDDERFTISTTSNFKPWPWFNNKLTVGVDKISRLAQSFTQIDTTGRAPFGAVAATGTISRNDAQNHQWTVDYTGTANTSLSETVSSATSVGMQYNARRYHSINGTGQGLVANSLNLIGSAAVTTAGESRTEQNSVGFFGQEQIGYKDRLYVTAAVRVDDNSAFGENFNLATYPKLSASYVISEAPFFNLSFVDQLKLRAAWGKAGNAPAPFSADRTLEASTVTLEDGSSSNAITTDAYGNPDLKAESGQEFELGFDAGLLNNRAGLEFTYYNQRTKDALTSISVPPSSGFGGSYLENIGEVANSGIEIAAYGSPIYTKNVSLDLRASFSTNHNEMIELGRDPIIFGSFSSVQQHRNGYPLGAYWGRDVLRDASGTPILDANGRATLADDTTFIGPSTPTREAGLAATLRLFGDIQLYASADYKGGHYLWSAREWWRSVNQSISYWVNSPDVPDAEKAAYSSGASTPFIDNADFIKLREVSVSYSLPNRIASRFGARGASLTLSGRNLGIWTKYDLGSDPELNFSGDATFSRTDYMSVPQMRYLVASMTVNF